MDRVPLNVTDAIEMFLTSLDEIESEKIKNLKDNEVAQSLQATIGKYLGNNWSLFEKNTPLVNSFESIGISHPDDMTSIIFVSARRKLNKKPVKLNDQVAEYQKFWKKQVGKPMP